MNHWYMAGWTGDVAEAPLRRVICNHPMVFYRTSDGRLAVLRDRCPHRFAPLSLGSVDADLIACPYHGLKFDRSGACVHNPFGAPPANAQVETFPVAERDGIIWVWTGADKAAAALQPVPD